MVHEGLNHITIIGAGRAGLALATALAERGRPPAEVLIKPRSSHDERLSRWRNKVNFVVPAEDYEGQSDLVFIATRDGELNSAARWYAERHRGPELTMIHLSGVRPAAEIQVLAAPTFRVGSFHPLVSLTPESTGKNTFEGIFFGLEGQSEVIKVMSELADFLGGRSFVLEASQKKLYHAAAVLVCGHLAALIDIGEECLRASGIEDSVARAAIAPLVASTFRNIAGSSPSDALTGPFVRGDLETVRTHLEVIEEMRSDDVRRVYLELGLRSVEMSLRTRPADPLLIALRDFILMAK